MFQPHNCFSGSHANINDSKVMSWVQSQTFDINTPYVFETIPGKKSWIWNTVCQSPVGTIFRDFFNVSHFRNNIDELNHSVSLKKVFAAHFTYKPFLLLLLFYFFFFHKSKYSLIVRNFCNFTCLKTQPMWPERHHNTVTCHISGLGIFPLPWTWDRQLIPAWNQLPQTTAGSWTTQTHKLHRIFLFCTSLCKTVRPKPHCNP